VEFIIDDDHIFDELIEFYLPFRVSELIKLDTTKTGYAFFSQFAEFFEFKYLSSIEKYHWADKVASAVNWKYSVPLYVALATYADKNKNDRALALDIIYCLIGLTNNQGFDDFEKHSVCSHIRIAEQVALQWGDDEIASFLVESALEDCWTPYDLKEYLDSSFWGILSELVGVESYFGHITEMIEEDQEYFFGWKEWDEFDFNKLIDLAKKSLDYLDDDTWAREIYKETLDYYGIADTESEYISEIAYSIAVDLKDKKWAEEVYKEILTYAHENTTPEGLREIEKSMDEALGGGR